METELDGLRRQLAELADDFGRVGADNPPLRHQWVWGDQDMSDRDWGAFFRANTRGVDWQEWMLVPGRMRAARFSEYHRPLPDYLRLAEKGLGVLREVARLAAGWAGPPGFRIELPPEPGVHGWTEAVYLTARHYATGVLSWRAGHWGVTGEITGEEDGRWVTTPDGERYPVNPAYEELHHNILLSSAEAIRLWLDPERAVTVGEVMEQHPCVVLTGWPERRAAGDERRPAEEPLRPQWTSKGELWVDGRLVKRYRQPSDNQRTILTVFDEEGWPGRIDDPLPGPCPDPKRRLRDTVESLNDNHQTAGLIRFGMDGTGTGVIWRRAGESAAGD